MKAEDIAAVQKLLQRPKPGKASECRCGGAGPGAPRGVGGHERASRRLGARIPPAAPGARPGCRPAPCRAPEHPRPSFGAARAGGGCRRAGDPRRRPGERGGRPGGESTGGRGASRGSERLLGAARGRPGATPGTAELPLPCAREWLPSPRGALGPVQPGVRGWAWAR